MKFVRESFVGRTVVSVREDGVYRGMHLLSEKMAFVS